MFPPSPRRLALARRAGLHAASPIVAGALACAAALAAAVVVASAAAGRIGAWIAAACEGAGGASTSTSTSTSTMAALGAGSIVRAVIELAAPVLVAAAMIAAVAHFAQTRALWLPRRQIDGAPARPRPARWLELAAPAVIGATCVAWLWLAAPRLAEVATVGGAGALIASFVATVACAWAGIGLVDALVRQLALREALAMSPAERREDDRLSASDPRWRARRAELARTPQIAGAAVVLLGDDRAVAISWDPARQPVPFRVATGTGARATQLVALARRHRIAVHRDVELARTLAESEGPVPDAHWARLAEIIAAIRQSGGPAVR